MVVDEPELTVLVVPEHENPFALQVSAVGAHEAGAVQVDPASENVPLLHAKNPYPLLVPVAAKTAYEPEDVSGAVPEHGTPDTVQVLFADAQAEGVQVAPPCSVHVPLLHEYVALPG